MEEELEIIYKQLEDTDYFPEGMNRDIFRSKIGESAVQESVLGHLVSTGILPQEITPDIFGGKVSEWTGGAPPPAPESTEPEGGFLNYVSQSYDFVKSQLSEAVNMGYMAGDVNVTDSAKDFQNYDKEKLAEMSQYFEKPEGPTEVGGDNGAIVEGSEYVGGLVLSFITSMLSMAVDSIEDGSGLGVVAAGAATGAVLGAGGGTVVPVLGNFAGLVGGGITGAGYGATAAMLASGANIEATSTFKSRIQDYASKKGLDASKPEDLEKIFEDENFMKNTLNDAIIAGGIVGGVDVATAGIGSKFGIGGKIAGGLRKTGASRKTANVAGARLFDGAGGSTGELLKQLAIEEKVDWQSVIEEGVVETFGGVADLGSTAMSNLANRQANLRKDNIIEAAQSGDRDGFKAGLEQSLAKGQIDQEVVDQNLEQFDRVAEKISRLPLDLLKNKKDRREAFDLINTIDNTDAEIEKAGKLDEALDYKTKKIAGLEKVKKAAQKALNDVVSPDKLTEATQPQAAPKVEVEEVKPVPTVTPEEAALRESLFEDVEPTATPAAPDTTPATEATPAAETPVATPAPAAETPVPDSEAAVVIDVATKIRNSEVLTEDEQSVADNFSDFDKSTDRESLGGQEVSYLGKTGVVEFTPEGMTVGGVEVLDSDDIDATNAELGLSEVQDTPQQVAPVTPQAEAVQPEVVVPEQEAETAPVEFDDPTEITSRGRDYTVESVDYNEDGTVKSVRARKSDGRVVPLKGKKILTQFNNQTQQSGTTNPVSETQSPPAVGEANTETQSTPAVAETTTPVAEVLTPEFLAALKESDPTLHAELLRVAKGNTTVVRNLQRNHPELFGEVKTAQEIFSEKLREAEENYESDSRDYENDLERYENAKESFPDSVEGLIWGFLRGKKFSKADLNSEFGKGSTSGKELSKTWYSATATNTVRGVAEDLADQYPEFGDDSFFFEELSDIISGGTRNDIKTGFIGNKPTKPKKLNRKEISDSAIASSAERTVNEGSQDTYDTLAIQELAKLNDAGKLNDPRATEALSKVDTTPVVAEVEVDNTPDTEPTVTEELATLENVTPQQAKSLGELIKSVSEKVAKRLKITYADYVKRLTFKVTNNSILDEAANIQGLGSTLDGTYIYDVSDSESAPDILFQSEESKAFVESNVEGIQKGNILTRALGLSQRFKDAVARNKAGSIDPELRQTLNESQKELGQMFRDKKGGTPEAIALKEKVGKLKEQVKAAENSGSMSLSNALEIVELEVADLINRVLTTDDFYITSLSDKFIDSKISQADAANNQQEVDYWTEIKNNEGLRQQQVDSIRKEQKSAISLGVNYIKNNTDYTPEFNLIMLDSVLKYNINNEGYISRRTGETVAHHNDMSSGVLPAVQEALLVDPSIDPIVEYSKNRAKGFLDKSDRKALAEKYVVEKRPNGYWLKFPQNSSEAVVNDLYTVTKETHRDAPKGSWCTGGSVSTAKQHNSQGDFYVFVDSDYNTQLAMKYNDSRLAESRGMGEGQLVEDSMQDEAKHFYDNYEGGAEFIDTYDFNRLFKKYDNYVKGVEVSSADALRLLEVHNVGDGSYNFEVSGVKKRHLKALLHDNLELAKRAAAKKYNVPVEGIYIVGADAISESAVISFGPIHAMASTPNLPNLKVVKGNLKTSSSWGGNALNLETVEGDIYAEVWEGHFHSLKTVGGALNLYNWKGEFPNLETLGGFANFEGWQGSAPKLKSIGGHAYFKDWQGSAPNLETIGGTAYLENWTGSAPKLKSIGGSASFRGWVGSAPQLETVGGNVKFGYWEGSAPKLRTVGGNVSFADWKGEAPSLETVGGEVDLRGWTGSVPKLKSVVKSLYIEDWTGTAPNLETIGVRVYPSKDIGTNMPKLKYLDGQPFTNPNAPQYTRPEGRGLIAKSQDSSTILLSQKLADVTTPVHEILHEYLRVINPQEIAILEEWSGETFGTPAFEEAFSIGGEKYIYDGRLENATKEQESVFKQFSEWFKAAIDNAVEYFGSVKELSPQVQEIYKSILVEESYKEPSPEVTVEETIAQDKQAIADSEVELTDLAANVNARLNQGEFGETENGFTDVFADRSVSTEDTPMARKGNAKTMAMAFLDNKVPSSVTKVLGAEKVAEIKEKALAWRELASKASPGSQTKQRNEAAAKVVENNAQAALEKKYSGITNNKAIINQAIDSVLTALKSFGVSVRSFNTPLEYQKAVRALIDNPSDRQLNSGGFYKDGQLFINPYPSDFRANTVYHEAAHAVFTKLFDAKSKDALAIHDILKNVLSSSPLATERDMGRKVQEFIDRYDNEPNLQAKEFFAELVGFLAEKRTKISMPRVKKIKQALNDVLLKYVGVSFLNEDSNVNDLIKLVNDISLSLSTGKDISSYESIKALIGEDPSMEYNETMFSLPPKQNNRDKFLDGFKNKLEAYKRISPNPNDLYSKFKPDFDKNGVTLRDIQHMYAGKDPRITLEQSIQQAKDKRESFLEVMTKLGFSPDKKDSVMTIYGEVANRWARETNRTPSEFWTDIIDKFEFVKDGDTIPDSDNRVNDLRKFVKDAFSSIKDKMPFTKKKAFDPQSETQATPIETENAVRDTNSAINVSDLKGARVLSDDGRAIIYLTSSADVVTPVHELAHVYETFMSMEDKAAVLKWIGQDKWNTKASEAFARGFESFLGEKTRTTNNALAKAFRNFSNWLKDIYKGLLMAGHPKVNMSMRTVYGKMFESELPGIEELRGDLNQAIADFKDPEVGLKAKNKLYQLFQSKVDLTGYVPTTVHDLIKTAIRNGYSERANAQRMVENSMRLLAKSRRMGEVGDVGLTAEKTWGVHIAKLELIEEIGREQGFIDQAIASGVSASSLGESYQRLLDSEELLSDFDYVLDYNGSLLGLELGMRSKLVTEANIKDIQDGQSSLERVEAVRKTKGLKPLTQAEKKAYSKQQKKLKEIRDKLIAKKVEIATKQNEVTREDLDKQMGSLFDTPLFKSINNALKDFSAEALDQRFKDNAEIIKQGLAEAAKQLNSSLSDVETAMLENMAITILRGEDTVNTVRDLTEAMQREDPSMTEAFVVEALQRASVTPQQAVDRLRSNEATVREEAGHFDSIYNLLMGNMPTEALKKGKILDDVTKPIEIMRGLFVKLKEVIAKDLENIEDTDLTAIHTLLNDLEDQYQDHILGNQKMETLDRDSLVTMVETFDKIEAIRYATRIGRAADFQGMGLQEIKDQVKKERSLDKVKEKLTDLGETFDPNITIDEAKQQLQDRRLLDRTKEGLVNLGENFNPNVTYLDAVKQLSNARRKSRLEDKITSIDNDVRELQSIYDDPNQSWGDKKGLYRAYANEYGVNIPNKVKPVPEDLYQLIIEHRDKRSEITAFLDSKTKSLSIEILGELWNIPRFMVLAADYSIIAYQMGLQTLSSPIQSARMIPRTIAASIGPGYYRERMDALKGDPDFYKFAHHGLQLNTNEGKSTAEELQIKTVLERLPYLGERLFKRMREFSERGYNDYANHTRFLEMKHLADGVTDTAQLEKIAEYVNTMTGTAQKFGGDIATNTANTIIKGATPFFIAPRLYASVFKSFVELGYYGTVKSGIEGFAGNKDRNQRRRFIKNMKILAGQSAVALGGYMLTKAFGEEGDDEKFFSLFDKQFGKASFGQTTISVSPFTSYTKIAGKILAKSYEGVSGKTLNDSKYWEKKTLYELITMDFLSTRTNPAFSAASLALLGKDWKNQKVDRSTPRKFLNNVVVPAVTPIAFQGLVENISENKGVLPTATEFTTDMFGYNTTTKTRIESTTLQNEFDRLDFKVSVGKAPNFLTNEIDKREYKTLVKDYLAIEVVDQMNAGKKLTKKGLQSLQRTIRIRAEKEMEKRMKDR